MARPSPSVQRVIAMLNFFADQPEGIFSLSELARALLLNKATCHSLLGELVNAGFLSRTSDRLYIIGPGFARLGQVANIHLSPLQVAKQEMRRLADEHDCVCSALFLEGGEVRVRERVASASHLSYAATLDMHWPLRPLFGSIYHAWSEPAAADAWMDGLSPPTSPAERSRTRDGMAFAREHGFQFVYRSSPYRQDVPFMQWLFLQDPTKRPLQLGTALDHDAAYRVEWISAPVFDVDGRVRFAIGTSRFNRAYRGADIARIGAQIRDACERVAGFLAGATAREEIPA
jgi:DNA-binding IclR family transcriptional regulator